MPKARSAEERTRFAEQNGYIDDISHVDGMPVSRQVEEYTDERCQVQLDLWYEFIKTKEDKSPLNLQNLKLFAELLASSTKGTIDKTAQVRSIRVYFRQFTSIWNRRNPMCFITRDLTDSVTNDIQTRIKFKYKLSDKPKRKNYLTDENYMYLERQLWENDSHDYVHEASRVFISAKSKCHVYTPARSGEISESTARRNTGYGLRYKDMVLLVAWKDGKPELRLSLDRAFTKGMHYKPNQRPQHILYEHIPNQLLVVQPMLFMLAVVLAAGAIKKYKTIEQLLDVQPPDDSHQWVFDWEESVLDWPVFPEVSANGPTWDKIQTASSFGHQLKELSRRAGMQKPVMITSGRREAIIKATENGYSNDELLKFAGHTHQITRTRDYLSSISSVDGLAGFLGAPIRKDLAKDFRSMTVRRNPELFLSLPAQARDELLEQPEYVETTRAIESLTRQINATQSTTIIRNLKSQRAELYDKRRRLEQEELERLQENQERIHPSERTEAFYVDDDRTRFNRLRHLMPARDRVADLLFVTAPLRSPEGICAINDLVSLIRDDCKVAYQKPLRPVLGRCPTPGCEEEIDRLEACQRWTHVFECSEAHHRAQYGFAEFCFLCSQWVTSKTAWESHCQIHLDRQEVPSRYNFVRFRQAIVYYGRCATCYRKTDFPASRRLHGYKKQASWVKHVNDCFTEYVRGLEGQCTIPCPHLGCSVLWDTEQQCWWHLQDAHSYPPRAERTKSSPEIGVPATKEECVQTRRKRRQEDDEQETCHTESGPKRRRPFPSSRCSANLRKEGFISISAEDFASVPTEGLDMTESTSSVSSPWTTRVGSLEPSVNSSGVSTPLSTLFDTGSISRADGLSATSTSSPAASFTVSENLGLRATDSFSPSFQDDPEVFGSSRDELFQLSDMVMSPSGDGLFQIALGEEYGDGGADEPSFSKGSCPTISSEHTFTVDDLHVSFPGGRGNSSQTIGLSLSNFCMDVVDPVLRTETAAPEPIEAVVEEAFWHHDRTSNSVVLPAAAESDKMGAESLPGSPETIDQPSPWQDYPVDCLLDKWGGWFFVKWLDGSCSWEPRENVLDDRLIDDLQQRHAGLECGVEVMRTRRNQGKNVEYRVHFLGRPKKEDEWVAEKHLSRELIEKHRPKRKTKRGKRKS